MQTTLLILSYVGKIAGFAGSLNAIPGVSPAHGVIIFFIASLLKDTVNRIGDFLDNGKTDWRNGPVILIGALFIGAGGITGCGFIAASTGGSAEASPATTTAQKIGNDLAYAESLAVQFQKANTALQTYAPTFKSLALDAGLLPANSKQATIFDAVVKDAAQASGDVSAVNAVLDPAALSTLLQKL